MHVIMLKQQLGCHGNQDVCHVNFTHHATDCGYLQLPVFSSDPPEHCHLTVKKLPKTWLFFQKNCQNCFFFKIANRVGSGFNTIRSCQSSFSHTSQFNINLGNMSSEILGKHNLLWILMWCFDVSKFLNVYFGVYTVFHIEIIFVFEALKGLIIFILILFLNKFIKY